MSPGPTDCGDAIEQLPKSLRSLITWERFHIYNANVFHDPARDRSFDTKYFPQNSSVFKLPCYWLPRRDLYVYGAQEDRSELAFFDGGGLGESVLFPIHPSAVGYYQEFLSEVRARDASADGLCIWAVPTSSTRTLLAWPDKMPERAVFVKTSLHSPILGDRRLHLRKVAASVGFFNVMHESRTQVPAGLGYFPEHLGFVPRRLQDAGAIVRSIPQSIKEGRVVVAPLFALFGGSGDYRPLFLRIVEATGVEPRRLAEDIFCSLFARIWLHMAMRLGLILEAHAQDLMLELSPDLVPTRRFLYRDFEGLQVDWELRHRLGLRDPATLPHALHWYDTYATRGTRCAQFVWYKWTVSLLCYLHLVVGALDESLRRWQQCGLIRDATFDKDELSMLFSMHLLNQAEKQFGIALALSCDRHSRYRFAASLMRARNAVMASSDPTPSETTFLPAPRL